MNRSIIIFAITMQFQGCKLSPKGDLCLTYVPDSFCLKSGYVQYIDTQNNTIDLFCVKNGKIHGKYISYSKNSNRITIIKYRHGKGIDKSKIYDFKSNRKYVIKNILRGTPLIKEK